MHDECRVFVALLTQRIELYNSFSTLNNPRKLGILTSNSVVKGLLGEVASLIRRVKDLVVEDRKVEGETKTDGMRRCKISGRDFSGSFVCLQ